MGKLLGVLAVLFSSVAWAQSPPIQQPTINVPITITTGNTFQTVLPSNGRRSLTIQNNNATDSCWITFGTLSNGTKITAGNAAKATSILLLAGGSYTRYWPYVPIDEIEGTCASNSDTMYADYQ